MEAHQDARVKELLDLYRQLPEAQQQAARKKFSEVQDAQAQGKSRQEVCSTQASRLMGEIAPGVKA